MIFYFCNMALSNIHVDILGDYVWNEEIQEYHENRINSFKYYFDEWLAKLGRIPKTINVNINVNYYPGVEKFHITYISARKREILEELKADLEFSNKYFQ